MKPFCEFMVKEIFPCLRAKVAQDLMDNYNISQNKAAELMGITQPAVSQYMRSLRGRNKKIVEQEEIKKRIKEISEKLYNKKISKDDLSEQFCAICDILAKSS